jgi:hypothetical protein
MLGSLLLLLLIRLLLVFFTSLRDSDSPGLLAILKAWPLVFCLLFMLCISPPHSHVCVPFSSFTILKYNEILIASLSLLSHY